MSCDDFIRALPHILVCPRRPQERSDKPHNHLPHCANAPPTRPFPCERARSATHDTMCPKCPFPAQKTIQPRRKLVNLKSCVLLATDEYKLGLELIHV